MPDTNLELSNRLRPAAAATNLTRAQQWWRNAYATIFSIRAMLSLADRQNHSGIQFSQPYVAQDIESSPSASGVATNLTRAQQRWRNAYATIFSIRAMLSLADRQNHSGIQFSQPYVAQDIKSSPSASGVATNLTRAQQRWRNAYATIFSIRAMLSLADRQNHSGIQFSQPYVAQDIESSPSASGVATNLTRAQQRWRNAYATIFSIRAMLSLADRQNHSGIQFSQPYVAQDIESYPSASGVATNLTRAQQRWRNAYATIFSIRAMLSLADRQNHSGIQFSQPYVAQDIESSPSASGVATNLTRAQQRWRNAYATIFSIRAMLSLADRQNHPGIQFSQPYVAQDIESYPSASGVATNLTRAQQRWRNAYATIFSIRAMLSLADRQNHSGIQFSQPYVAQDIESSPSASGVATNLTRAQQRWRNAYATIFSIRAMLSLADRQNHPGIQFSQPYVAQDIESYPSASGVATNLTRAQQRWRNAYATIFSIRAMLSLADTQNHSGIQFSQPYVAQDIESSPSASGVATNLTRVQQRWRNAYATIFSIRAMLSLADRQNHPGIQFSQPYVAQDIESYPSASGVATNLTRAQQRWRNAYATIFSIRAMLSLADRQNHSGIQFSQPYVAQDIESSPSASGVATNLTRAQQRWRNAYATIFSIRAMLSLADRQNHSGIQFSQPDVPQDIESSTPASGVDKIKLGQMVKDKDSVSLGQLGGVEGVAAALGTNPENGIRDDEEEIRERQEKFGSNTYQKPPTKGFFYFVVDAFKDTTILILLVCAALALGYGIKEHGAQKGWYEGGSIFIAVFLVVVVSAFSNFRQQAHGAVELWKIINNIRVDVVRDGRRRPISIFDLVVGDVVCLKIGDQIPADGLFLTGHYLQVYESIMTGESDHVEVDSDRNPFLFSGSKVADGFATMLVASVGMSTAWASISRDSNERTPIQDRLDKLTSSIRKIGYILSFLTSVIIFIHYFTGHNSGFKKYASSHSILDNILNEGVKGIILNVVFKIIAAAVSIVVVANSERRSLAVTLTVDLPLKRMKDDGAMVRKPSACEKMGLATVICTDKTGTLTLNQMKVAKCWVGPECIADDSSNSVASNVLEVFNEAVGLNTTESVFNSASGSEPEISGSPTEKVILSWAVSYLRMDMEKLKQNYNILHVVTFNSERKRSGVLVKKNADSTIHVHWKGAAEMILAMCSNYYDSNGETRLMNEDARSAMEKIIEDMAASSLRCIAFAHKQVSEEETEGNDDQGNSGRRIKEDGLTLLGIVGLENPCRKGVREAVGTCKSAGVEIKMITGDNVFTAKAIATECGILGSDSRGEDEVVEGVEFRNYTPEERMQKVDKIKVMARSSPSDKLLMVKCLRQKGHVVAITGDRAEDAPALKEADIGLSMGIQGTEVAKESSRIVILDDSFTSVVMVLKWGRSVYNNIQKFIQFQLTVNVAALAINLIAVVSGGEVPLTAVQLLWVNLIVDPLGALALATDRPTEELMRRRPVSRYIPLITNKMWRNLLAQAVYMIAILLVFQFKGESLFKITPEVNHALMFNTFVFCQVFNMFNSRKIGETNVFRGILKNRLFLGIVAVTVILQLLHGPLVGW
ncbi:hypothetical protein SLE2022_245570 [Rubroshorea leprosula]